METALFLSGLGYLVAIMDFVVAIGFLITLLVGQTSGNEITFKVGKKGTLIAGIVLAASLVLGFGAGAVENSIATQRNNRFDNYAEKYTKLYAKRPPMPKISPTTFTMLGKMESLTTRQIIISIQARSYQHPLKKMPIRSTR